MILSPLIELRDEAVLQRTETMLMIMGKDYDYQMSDEVGRELRSDMRFSMTNRKVEVVEPGRVFPDPVMISSESLIMRRFRGGIWTSLTIAIHIILGRFTVRGRRKEIRKIADVYTQVQQMKPLRADIILVGDFNRSRTI